MATTFDVIFLGTLPLIDTTQGNEIAENAAGLLGSYGTAASPLSENVQTLSANFLGFDDNATYDTDNRDLLGLIAEYDSFRINGGTVQNFDALSVYDATITYFDGTTATISAVVFQDVTGNTYLAPELALNADQAALTAKPITSLSLNSVLVDNGDMGADRIAGDFKTVVDGTIGSDTITLTSGYVDAEGDAISTGDDFVLAGDGDDFVNPDDGNDVVYGGLGNDTIDGGNQNDTLYGGDGADSIIGGNGNDSILGGDGDDHLQSGAGSDTVFGDAGNDVIAVSDDHDTNTIDGGSGYDQLVFATPTSTSGVTVTWTGEGAGTYDFNTTTSTGTFTSIEQSSGTLYADTYDASDTSTGVAVFSLDGDDTLIGGSGADWLYTDAGNDSVHAGAGADTIDGGAGADYLKGQAGNDSIVGGSGADTLTGDAGADTLDGGLDNDYVTGGSGSDSLLGGGGDDTIRGDNMWFALSDYPSTAGTATNLTVTNTAEGPIELWYINTSGVLEFRQSIASGQTVNQAATTGDNFVLRAPGGWYLELIEGGNQTVVYGADGLNDTIDGGAGNDIIYGEFGDDSIAGGAGADTIDGGYGDDTILGGTGNDSLTGADGSDLFIVQDAFGQDTIIGGEGAVDLDTIDLTAVTTPVTVTYTGNEAGTITDGTNTITFSQIEHLILTEGADFVDPVADGVGAWIEGRGGDDTILGGQGNDTIDGGDGNDYLEDLTGDDTILGGAGEDYLKVGRGNNLAVGGDGADTIFAIEGGADTLDGGADADFFDIRTLGNVVITGGETTTAGGRDVDRVDIGPDTAALTVNITGAEAGTISDGISTITFTGIEELDLGSGNDTVNGGFDTVGLIIDGDDGNDVFNLSNTSGANVLDGQGGNDNIFSGSGNDTIFGGSGSDRIEGGGGNDSLSGGGDNDTILGGSGNDTLDGVQGDDSLDGGAGDDLIFGGDGNDTLVAGNNTGAGDTLVGGNGDDLLIDSFWNATLDGGDGSDTIEVGYGQATVIGGEDIDGTDVDRLSFVLSNDAATVVFNGNEAGIYSDSDGDGGTFAQIEEVYGSGQADSIDAALDNSGLSLAGLAGNDTLIGGSGADTLQGGADNDSLTGGDGDDLFIVVPGDGLDTISDFNSGNTGALGDADATNNDYIDLTSYYDTIFEVWADQADDGILNQSNTTDTKGNTTDYSNNSQFVSGQGIVFRGASADNSFFTTDNTGVVCFARGTLILTTQGEVPLERLSPGAMIVTRDNGPQPLVWVASRKLGRADLTRAPKLRPIRLAPDLIGAHAPLIMSPQHAVLFRTEDGDEQLVRATHLAKMRGGKARVMQGCRAVSYFHLAFGAHQIIFANGAATESFYPGPQAVSALTAEARQEISALFPDLVPARAKDTYCAQARQITRFCDLPDHLGALAQARW
ncbi:MAG: Hint domain-containing protein [Marivita sp.]|uniref:Hint domain-containing protein n=1 Tax=Marivita sp. TaxID=2003365 RepID=UPI001B2733B8|nr:Hint domain-containing protein [Marivita sp.]MBO6885205.1 Hint domain-containing protein [Marivita sp.]